MKKTPLHEKHLGLDAKMQDFAGFDMPIQYTGIPEETLAVRENCGIFDVSHMGEIRVTGKASEAFLNWVLSRPIDGKKESIVSYVVLCEEGNGAVDDFLVYRFAPEHDFWLVVNAANTDKDFDHLLACRDKFYELFPQEPQDIVIENESKFYGQVALQGPKSPDYMKKFLEARNCSEETVEQILSMKGYRTWRKDLESGLAWVISRTGYTGEDGFEIYCPAEDVVAVWDFFMAEGVTPCGLGARDCLRLEAGMPLYGHEMSAELNALDAGMSFVVKDHEPFIAGALKQTKKIIPLVSVKMAVPREGYPVKGDGEEIGYVSSGSYSPTLKKGIAYAMVDVDFDEAGVKDYTIEIHGKERPFEKTKLPFINQ